MDLSTARMHRRELVKAGAGLALATFGFRSQGVSASDAVVRFAYFGTPEEQRAYEALVSAFERVHPEIAVETVALPSGDATLVDTREGSSPYQPWLRQAVGTDEGPDVFLLNYRNLGEFTARGTIQPLDDRLATGDHLRAEEFYPGALDAFRYRTVDGSALGGIPQNASSLVVYYNQDVFDELGVPYPANDWTWEQFAETAARLTVDRDGDGRIGTYGLAIEPSISRFAAFIWGAGGDFVNDPELPTRLDFDNPGAQDGLAYLMSLGQSGRRVTPNGEIARSETDLSRFLSGRAAMFVHTRRVVATLRAKASMRWDVAPLPLGKQAANVLHVDGFCLATAARNPDAAWEFIAFANGPRGQTMLAQTGRTVPSLKSVAESDDFLRGTTVDERLGMTGLALPPANARVFVDNVAISRRLPAIASWPSVEWEFNRAVRSAFYGDGDVARVTTRIARRSTGLLGTPMTSYRNLYLENTNESEE